MGNRFSTTKQGLASSPGHDDCIQKQTPTVPTESQPAAEAPQGPTAAGDPVPGIELFRFINGAWQLISSNATPLFYDADADNGGEKKNWHLEIAAVGMESDINTRADASLGFLADLMQQRVTFELPDASLWSLRFPTEELLNEFVQELNEDIFENTYGYVPDSAPENGEYVYYSAGGSTAEPMEADAQPEAPELLEEQEELGLTEIAEEVPTCHSLVMGTGSQSYLHHGAEFSKLRNHAASVTLEPEDGTFSIKAIHGTPVESSQVLLAKNETAMNMLYATEASKLLHADIERSQVVSEWQMQHDGVALAQRAIAPCSKADQVTANLDSVLSMAHNRLCRWDLRAREGVVQVSGPLSLWDNKSGQPYTKNPDFTCIAVSGAGGDGNGYVVVGSADGIIRLFNNKSLKPAKTTIAGLGKPITAVDVTYDGHWVIATTDDYVMVVNTHFKDEGGAACCAFTHAGRHQLQPPRLLRLTPEDKRRTQNAPLKNAHFSWVMEDNTPERWISATCGKHTVLWNFRRVKTARATCTSHNGMPTLHQYHLSAPSPEDISDSKFMHSSSARDARVVATNTRLYTIQS